MFKKILSIVVISGLFSSGALAEDLLAKITNGAVSDTSEGVRVLSAEEEKQVVGGYVVNFLILETNYMRLHYMDNERMEVEKLTESKNT